MSQDEANPKELRGGDPLDPITPLLTEVSSNLERNRINLWGTSFYIASWVRKYRSVFKRRGTPSNASETEHEQSTPLNWEELEATSQVPTIDDGPRFASLEYLGPWFSEANPAHPKAQIWRTWRSKRQTVLSTCSIVACLVLLINVAGTIYFKIRWKTTDDLGTIYRGNCSQSHRLSSSLHILINILSTTLLGVSNLCMQLLAAPTCREIDEAHGKHAWLDIGIPSFRNLSYISKRRSTAIWLLAI